MNWVLFAILGAGCGWLTSGPLSGKRDANVIGAMAGGAIAAVLLGVLVSFVFSALFFLIKITYIVFGVLIVLALLGAGDSD